MIFNFPETLFARFVDSDSDIVELGDFTPDQACDLIHAIAGFTMQGTLAGTMKLRLHTSNNFTKIFAESEPINLAELIYNVGNVRFDFSKRLQLNQKYYITAKTTGYTRTGDTDYVAFLHDAPFPVNLRDPDTRNYPTDFPIKLALFGKV